MKHTDAAKVAALMGNHGFPVAMASKSIPTNILPLKRFYLYAFSHPHQDWIAIGSFNTLAEANKELIALRAQTNHGVVLEQTWDEFVTQATQSRLGKLAEALEKLGLVI